MNHTQEHQWPNGWEEHERAQLRRMAQLSPAQKLEWLSQAHRMVRHLEALREARQKDTAHEHQQS